jgi:hypothetical protein
MRLLGILGALCILAVPVLGNIVSYTFNTTAGAVALNIAGQGSTASGMAGTFGIVMDQGHIPPYGPGQIEIGPSDSFLLDHSYLANTSTMKLSLAGLATATLNVQSARFLDFGAAWTHIEPGGNQIANTDVYVEATVFVTGLTTTTFSTKTWAKTLLPFNVMFLPLPAYESDILIALISGTFGYEVGISDIGLTITLDLIVNVEGTAHVVPDPALGGVAAMGLAGAGAWLRRRR